MKNKTSSQTLLLQLVECCNVLKAKFRKETAMTHNQIEYQKLQETKRANLISEAELNRTHLANESIGREGINLGYANLAETSRHNIITEQVSWGQLDVSRENAKSNAIQANAASINASTNSFNSIIDAQYKARLGSAAITQAAAASKNATTNATNAQINQQNADINATNAATNVINASTNSRNASTNAFNAGVNAFSKGVDAVTSLTPLLN